MITIRSYSQGDAVEVGILIADTYRESNLDCAPSDEIPLLLGPFQHARSTDETHRQQIARMIHSEIVLVAEDRGEIVGILRGRKERLGSLFVRKDYHRQGVGRILVEHFEQECFEEGSTTVRVASTLYAVPFYTAQGYRNPQDCAMAGVLKGRGSSISR